MWFQERASFTAQSNQEGSIIDDIKAFLIIEFKYSSDFLSISKHIKSILLSPFMIRSVILLSFVISVKIFSNFSLNSSLHVIGAYKLLP